MADSVFDFLNEYRLLLRLWAESSGLEWGKDAARIREIAGETDRLHRELALPSRDGAPEVGGLYLGGEDLCSVWMGGEVDPKAFAFHMLDFLVRELNAGSCFQLHTTHGAAHIYGAALIDGLFELTDEAMSTVEVQWRRFESVEGEDGDEEERPIVVRLDQMDERFDEAPACKCQPGDEGATQITLVEIDGDAFQALGELIEQRDALARRAARGEGQADG